MPWVTIKSPARAPRESRRPTPCSSLQPAPPVLHATSSGRVGSTRRANVKPEPLAVVMPAGLGILGGFGVEAAHVAFPCSFPPSKGERG